MVESANIHQFVDRRTGQVCEESLYWDRAIRFLYSSVREQAPALFSALTSPRASSLLGFINFESFVGRRVAGSRRFMARLGIDEAELVDPPERLRTLGAVFERKIRYWECRPMADDVRAVVSPADARVICGSLRSGHPLFLKGKFFDLDELLGGATVARPFSDGDWAIFRLTPDKYHYNHNPVAGLVEDFFAIDGVCHACNPAAVIEMVTPYSKNRRHVTIVDTDVPGGTHVGRVAIVEVTALMIGDVIQCYSDEEYRSPRPMSKGLFLRKGMPKSRYRPGGSTDVLIFQRGRVQMCNDLLGAQRRTDVSSRLSRAFGVPLAESEVKVRSTIGLRNDGTEQARET